MRQAAPMSGRFRPDGGTRTSGPVLPGDQDGACGIWQHKDRMPGPTRSTPHCPPPGVLARDQAGFPQCELVVLGFTESRGRRPLGRADLRPRGSFRLDRGGCFAAVARKAWPHGTPPRMESR